MSRAGVTMGSADESQILTMFTRLDGDVAVVELSGELDLHESDRLSALIAALLDRPVASVEIDASGLTFVDSGGVRALLVARSDAEQRGIDLRVSVVSSSVGRIMRVAGVDEALLGHA